MRPSRLQLAVTSIRFFCFGIVTFFGLLVAAGPCRAESGAQLEPLSMIFCASENIGFEGEILVPLDFLQRKQLKDELSLSKIQAEKFSDMVEKTKSAFRQERAGSDTRERVAREVDEARRRVVDILKTPQIERLKGIMLQLYGIWTVSTRDMRESLHLTTDQEFQLDEIRAGMFSRINETLENPVKGGSADGCRIATADTDRRKAIVREGEQSIMNVLSTEQRKALDGMKGRPFKLGESS